MAKIKVVVNGPYLVEGTEIVDAQGQLFPVEPGKPVALCRCGASSRKPFCDGTHAKVGFRSDENAASFKVK